jgi:hypothetical protein
MLSDRRLEKTAVRRHFLTSGEMRGNRLRRAPENECGHNLPPEIVKYLCILYKNFIDEINKLLKYT